MLTLQTFGNEELFLQCLATNVNSITTFKKRRREHESRPPESKRKYTPKNPCSRCNKGITSRSRAISCDSCGQWTHNRCASVFSDETYDELCNSGYHFTFVCQRCSFYPFRSPTTRPTTTSVTFLRLPRHQTSMMRDILRMALTSNPTHLTGFFYFKEKACIL